MTQEELLRLQRDLCERFGGKVDVYHSEEHRGVIAVPHGHSLDPFNVIYRANY